MQRPRKLTTSICETAFHVLVPEDLFSDFEALSVDVEVRGGVHIIGITVTAVGAAVGAGGDAAGIGKGKVGSIRIRQGGSCISCLGRRRMRRWWVGHDEVDMLGRGFFSTLIFGGRRMCLKAVEGFM